MNYLERIKEATGSMLKGFDRSSKLLMDLDTLLYLQNELGARSFPYDSERWFMVDKDNQRIGTFRLIPDCGAFILRSNGAMEFIE